MDEKEATFYKPVEEESKWQGCKKFVWDSDKGEFFGRTGISWLKITVFYIIFYACLAAFWTCMLVIFYQTLKNNEPKWQLGASRIGDSPGLGFRPSPPEENIDSTLIWFNVTNPETTTHWIKELDDYLSPYKMYNEHGDKIITCSSDQRPSEDKVCHFPLNEIPKECSNDTYYGYQHGTPCVLVKLNKIYGWIPEPYEDFPDDVPATVKNNYGSYNSTGVWITCDGEKSADKDNIGELDYFPQQFIPFYFFPFKNQKGYVSPIVFVRFKNPTKGVLINIECKGWAKQIVHESKDRLGSVHFELLIDE